MATRKEIMIALFDLLRTASGVEWKTASRRLRHWSEVDRNARPALFLSENGGERMNHPSETLTTREIQPTIVVYTWAPKDNEALVPADQLNDILEAIETALTPAGRDLALFGRQTLGGLVSHVFINGEIEKDPGDMDEDGILIVPLSVLVP